jgi:hypothetical protein
VLGYRMTALPLSLVINRANSTLLPPFGQSSDNPLN